MCVSTTKNITKVIVFKTDGLGGNMPPGCKNGPVSNRCNVYTNRDFNHTRHGFEIDNVPEALSWPAENRKAALTDDIDYVGVYVEMEVGGVTGPWMPTSVDHTTIVKLQASSI